MNKNPDSMLLIFHFFANLNQMAAKLKGISRQREGAARLERDLVHSSLSMELTADYATPDELQRRYIRQVIEKTGGRISGPAGAAAIIGGEQVTARA